MFNKTKLLTIKRKNAMKKLLLIWVTLSLFILTSCTMSITIVHTQGQAPDVVDETDTVSPSTSVNIPVSVLPKPTL